MHRSTKSINFVLETEIIEKLKQDAELEKRTLSSMIRTIIKSYYRQQPQEACMEKPFQAKEGTCGRCVYFEKHYVKQGIYFSPVSCGHCARPRELPRKPFNTACEGYRENKHKNPPEE